MNELRNQASGSVGKQRIAQDQGLVDRILGILADLPVSSMGAALLATKASIIQSSPTRETTKPEHNLEKTDYS